MKSINNVFYVDEHINETIKNIKHDDVIKVNAIADSTMVSIHENSERRNIWFKPLESNFTYEVNGHFFGTFFYVNDKVTAKWPNRLNDKERKTIIKELQTTLRNIV